MIKQKIKFLLFIFIIINCLTTFSQTKKTEDKPFKTFKDRLFFGGSLNLSFGSFTMIEVSPMAGVYITPRLSSGLGIIYKYYNDSRSLSKINTHIYGSRVFTNFLIIDKMNKVLPVKSNIGIFVHTEYEALSLENKYFRFPQFTNTGRFWIHSWLLGGGIRQPIGKRSSFEFAILWNLTETKHTPYSSPIIRMGINF